MISISFSSLEQTSERERGELGKVVIVLEKNPKAHIISESLASSPHLTGETGGGSSSHLKG